MRKTSTTASVISVKMVPRAWTESTSTPACVHRPSLVPAASRTLTSAQYVRPCVTMVRPVQIHMGATRVSA